MTTADWPSVTASNPCEICGGKTWCTRSVDGDVANCERTRETPHGWWKMKDRDEPSEGAVFKRGTKPQPKTGPDLDELSAGFQRAARGDLVDELAVALWGEDRGTELRDGLKQLSIGYSEDDVAYSFPERVANGDIVAINLQTAHRGKWMVAGPKARGLFIPRNLMSLPDPVLIVEGASDTATMVALGIAAVGRPNNVMGFNEIVKLLENRDAILIGEFDVKDDGRWPGRDAAVNMAGKLALAWGQTMAWSMPPNRAKDVRRWVNDQLEAGWPLEQIRETLIAKVNTPVRDGGMQQRVTGPTTTGSGTLVSNVMDVTEQGKRKRYFIPVHLVIDQLQRATDGFPRRVGNLLFATTGEAPDGHLPSPDDWRILSRTADLFGWMHQKCNVRWTKREAEDRQSGDTLNPPTKDEFHSTLSQCVQPMYDAVETLPHYPEIANTYYLPCNLPESDGTALAEFTSRLNPATDLDRDLMVAVLLTLAWGGPPGKRPGVCITSEFGRGAGKTRTAELLTEPFGGHMMMSEKEDFEKFRGRLLDDAALKCRAVLIDNLKGRLSSSGIESALTSKVIDGHRMYTGQSSRPNNMTWIITANTPKLSKDITDRCLVIKVGATQHSSDFETWWLDFIARRRAELISDVLARLARGQVADVDEADRDRWGPWIDGVLRTFDNARELMRYINSERVKVDVDSADAEAVVDVLRAVAQRVWNRDDVDIHTCRIQIAKRDLRNWLAYDGRVIDDKVQSRGATNRIMELLTLAPLAGCLGDAPGHGSSRSWLWTGRRTSDRDPVITYDEGAHGPADPHRGSGGQTGPLI